MIALLLKYKIPLVCTDHSPVNAWHYISPQHFDLCLTCLIGLIPNGSIIKKKVIASLFIASWLLKEEHYSWTIYVWICKGWLQNKQRSNIKLCFLRMLRVLLPRTIKSVQSSYLSYRTVCDNSGFCSPRLYMHKKLNIEKSVIQGLHRFKWGMETLI
jgi:hypothetical protein